MTDEELRVVGVGSSVSHGQDSPCFVLQGKVLILKLLAVDRFPTSSIMVDEVSSTRRYITAIPPIKSKVWILFSTGFTRHMKRGMTHWKPDQIFLSGTQSMEVLC